MNQWPQYPPANPDGVSDSGPAAAQTWEPYPKPAAQANQLADPLADLIRDALTTSQPQRIMVRGGYYLNDLQVEQKLDDLMRRNW